MKPDPIGFKLTQEIINEYLNILLFTDMIKKDSNFKIVLSPEAQKEYDDFLKKEKQNEKKS